MLFYRVSLLVISLLSTSLVDSLVRRGSGVVLVKISSITNTEGRDAAGTCCNGDSDESGVCSGNCFSMLRICASEVKEDSVLRDVYNNYQQQQQYQQQQTDKITDREDTQARNPVKKEKIRIKPATNNFRPPIGLKPPKPDGRPPPRPQRRPPPSQPKPQTGNKFPFGPIPNIFRSRSNIPPPQLSRSGMSRQDHHQEHHRQEPEMMRVWEPEEFTVMWRDSRMLLKEDSVCRYGAINTDVIFNNSLGGGQRDLLIKLPFEESWPGMFELTMEVWHNAHPKKIPQLQAQSKKSDDKGILATIFDTLATQLTKTVNDFETKRLQEAKSEDVDDVDSNNDNSTEVTTNEEDETTMSSVEETTMIVEDKSEVVDNETAEHDTTEQEKDRLIMRLEREHLIFADSDWQTAAVDSYHSSVKYSVKLACSKEFTGRTCSYAKLCLNPNIKNHPRLVCTKEGEIVCRPGWEGATCERPICAGGCDPDHGYCEKPGECKCKVGYHGQHCDQCDKLLGCSRNGFCEKAFECQCYPGWRGLFCTEPVCSEGCHNKFGYCSRPGECRCRAGWQGETCDQCTPAPGCDHGHCSAPGECHCDQGWRGELCDQPDCADTCDIGHGYCLEPGQCECRVGWSGERCDTCVPYPGCVNGHCSEAWSCHCEAGWTGVKCDQIETEEFGLGIRDGRCQSGNRFLCMNGGLDVCSWTGNGTMIDHPRCKCKPGFGGKYCQDTLNRNGETVFSVLPSNVNDLNLDQHDDTVVEDDIPDVFPDKLDNSLEKL